MYNIEQVPNFMYNKEKIMYNINKEKKTNEFKLKRERISRQIPYLENEQQTKNVLIEPILRILDYDTENIDIIKGEYTIRGGKRIDYQVMINGAPSICIEAKKVTEKLSCKNIEQLACYVSETNSKIGVLTNGKTWAIFKTEANGAMNKKPFRVIKDITRLTEKEFEEIIEEYNYDKISQRIRNTMKRKHGYQARLIFTTK